MELQEMKASVETLGRAFEEFKSTHAKSQKDGDVLLEQKMNKIAEDIGLKLEAVQKHTDELAAKLGRPAAGGGADAEKKYAEALEFKRQSLIVQRRYNPEDEIEGNVKEYEAYTNAFLSRLRKGDSGLNPNEVKALSVGADPDGGYLVTPAMSSRIMTRVYESSPMRALATVERISTDSLEIPVDIDEAGAGWIGETQTRTETTTPNINKQAIPVHEMFAEPRATQKLLEDASVDMERWLTTKVADRFARLGNAAFVNGDGVNKPRGFTTYTAGTNWNQIEQVVSGAAAAVTADGLIDLVASVKEPYLPNAGFGFRRATIANVMKLKHNSTGTGDFIFNMIFTEGIPRAFLLGYPVRFLNDMAAVGAGALPIVFGDMQQAYTIVERVGISVLRDPFTTKGFVKFYTRARVGGAVTNFEAIKLQRIAAS